MIQQIGNVVDAGNKWSIACVCKKPFVINGRLKVALGHGTEAQVAQQAFSRAYHAVSRLEFTLRVEPYRFPVFTSNKPIEGRKIY
jgi:hypothetical protein